MFEPLKAENLRVGSYMGDAHYGVPELEGYTHTLTRIQVKNAHEVVKLIMNNEGIYKAFTNKDIYLIGEGSHGPEAVYSYDGNTLGFIKYYPTEDEEDKEPNH